jgi:hypothetical protein
MTTAMHIRTLQPRWLRTLFACAVEGVTAFAVGVDCKRTPGRADPGRDSP